jgi:uncharacterized protein
MHIPHELPDEFPDETVLIARLTKTNYLFRRLAGRYDKANRVIFRIESGDERTADEVLEKLKRERLKLKDRVTRTLTWGRAPDAGRPRRRCVRRRARLRKDLL